MLNVSCWVGKSRAHECQEGRFRNKRVEPNTSAAQVLFTSFTTRPAPCLAQTASSLIPNVLHLLVMSIQAPGQKAGAQHHLHKVTSVPPVWQFTLALSPKTPSAYCLSGQCSQASQKPASKVQTSSPCSHI